MFLCKKSIASALVGVSSPEQVLGCVGSIENLIFTNDELFKINKYAIDVNINPWANLQSYKRESYINVL